MKKIITTILAIAMILAVIPATAMAAQLSRCPMCGAENAFSYYSKDCGYCYKCHRTNDTVCYTVTVKSDALRFDEAEVILYQNGKVERMAVVPSGEQTILFSGLQRGVYTIAINMNGYMPIYQAVWLYNKEQSAYYNLHLRGDVNGDGIVSEIDYNMVNNYLNHRGWLYGAQYQYADINSDWRVDRKDLDIYKLVVFD